MRKSLFLCLLLLTIALTSCGNNINTPVKTNAILYGYDVFPGTDWGMTKQEILDIYNLSEKDIEEGIQPTEGFSDAEYGFSFITKVYDSPSKLKFIFTKNKGDYKKDIGLVMVKVHFLDTEDIKVRHDIRLRYEEDFENAKNGRIEDEDSHYPNNVIADLKDKQLQQKVLDVLAQMYKKELNQDIKTFQEHWKDTVQLSTLHLNLDKPYLGEQTHIRYEGLVSAIINSLE